MHKITKTVTIQAPVERVFAYVTNPNNLPEVWPAMVEVSNAKFQDDGSHSFDWVYKMAGIRFKGHSKSTEAVKHRRVVAKTEGGIPATFRWSYEPAGNNTKLTMECEYAIPNKLLDRIAEPIVRRLNEHEAETVLNNVKARMELGKPGVTEVHAPAE